MTIRRLLNIGTLVLCLVALIVINAVSRDDSPGERWYRGTVGQWVTSPQVDVRVDAIELAREVSAGSTTRQTPGVFVVVHWSAAAKGETAYLSKVYLLTGGGLQVAQRDEFLYVAGISATDAGFTSHGASVFEIQPDQLTDLRLRVDHNRGVFYTYSGGVEVQLPADQQTPIVELAALPAPQTEVTR